MTLRKELSVVIAGGGTAGHVNPMLAVASELQARHPHAHIVALGTEEGLEKKLVPEAGFTLYPLPKVPFPRRLNSTAMHFPYKFYQALSVAKQVMRKVQADVVFGVGGYASTPAYVAAQQLKIPYVIHEANMIPGLANKWGVRKAAAVGVAFKEIPLPSALHVGMPMKKEISTLDRLAFQQQARKNLGLAPDKITLIVTGGSSGAQSINEELVKNLALFEAANIQILHLVGHGKKVPVSDFPHYIQREFVSRMENVYAAADMLLCRAGAGTVSEVCAVGVPAIFIPLPLGNGEQKRNAQPVVDAGAAVMISNDQFSTVWIRDQLIPLLQDSARCAKMSTLALSLGIRNADQRMADMIEEVADVRG